MKNRRFMTHLITALVAGSAVFSTATRQDEVTLVMVPREEEAIRLGMDVANRYPTLLISYKLGVNNAVSLHGWTGSQWVNVKVDDFQAGNFFKKGPDSALIVEKTGIAVPAKMLPPSDWCASVAKIKTTEMRPLLHLVGQYYDFSYEAWQWFAKRYGMGMDAINPEGLNVAWYHRRMEDHLKPHEQQAGSDLRYWTLVRYPVADEPAVATPKPEEPAKASSAAEEVVLPMEEGTGNPLANDAPAAVIMGVADADEELGDASAGKKEAVESSIDEGAKGEEPTEGKSMEDVGSSSEVVEEEVEKKTEDPALVDVATVESEATEGVEEPMPVEEDVVEKAVSVVTEEME